MSLPASICLVRDGAVIKSTSTSPLDELKSEERRVETILGNPGEAGKFRMHKDRENASAGWFMLPCLLCLRCFPPEWYELVNWGLMPQSTLRLRAAPQCRTEDVGPSVGPKILVGSAGGRAHNLVVGRPTRCQTSYNNIRRPRSICIHYLGKGSRNASPRISSWGVRLQVMIGLRHCFAYSHNLCEQAQVRDASVDWLHRVLTGDEDR